MTLEIDLSGRTALVTGGGNGIGAEICGAFVRAGASVWVNDINEERAAKVAADLGGEPAARPIKADVTSPLKITRMRGTRPGRHPREQRGHPDAGVRVEGVRRYQPRGLGSDDAAQPRRDPPRHTRVPRRDGRHRVGPCHHRRLRCGPARRALPGDLRLGQGRRDGIHARHRGRGRPARRDRELSLARNDALGPHGRRGRRKSRSRAQAVEGIHDPPARAAGRRRARSSRCCAATRARGSPGRCTRSTAATSRRCSGHRSGATPRPPRRQPNVITFRAQPQVCSSTACVTRRRSASRASNTRSRSTRRRCSRSRRSPRPSRRPR